jgi:tRNA dimethylallyltransferase
MMRWVTKAIDIARIAIDAMTATWVEGRGKRGTSSGKRESRTVNESVATLTDGHNERVLTPGLELVVILGATATGKSSLAMELAASLDAEIVSSDSRYLYRGMDIGTAKPSRNELNRVPHHLVDILDPADDYSLANYLDDAFAAIEEIWDRGRLPVVAGGTPLYLRALLQGWTVPRVPPDQAYRSEMEQVDAADLLAQLQNIDPVTAERTEANNKRRLIRALEVFRGSGRPLSELEGRHPPPYRMLVLGLFQPRDRLYRRIDERVRWMFDNGLLDEARRLIELNVPESAASMSAIGYREARAVVASGMEVSDAVENTCHATHRYVRHQETWFKRFEDVVWLDSSEPDTPARAAELVREFLGAQDNATGSPVDADS